jgi:hypothetical protein
MNNTTEEYCINFAKWLGKNYKPNFYTYKITNIHLIKEVGYDTEIHEEWVSGTAPDHKKFHSTEELLQLYLKSLNNETNNNR